MTVQHIQDTVSIELSVEEAIVSDTVKVSVDVVLATKAEDATDVRGTVLEALKAVLDVDWAFARLDRSTNRSGLEEVFATATARVPESQVAGLNTKAKEISREGLQLTVGDLDYNPARNLVDAAVKNLRKEVYVKAQEEADLLNELITKGDAPWRVANVSFYDGGPRMKMANARGMMLESVSYAAGGPAGGAPEAGFDLTQKVGLSASVVLQRIAS